MSTSGPPPEPEDDNATRSFPPAASPPTVPAPNADAPPSAGAWPPDTGRFRRISVHRTGGMGRIHLALDTELNRRVAFKEVRPDLAHHAAILDHFLFEAEVTGRLEHPGVVPVYGLGRFPDGRPYYAMRFITGESLEDAIAAFHGTADPTGSTAPVQSAADRAVALRRLLARFLTVCQTVGFAHSQGVIHRDLKPSNVMLGKFGETLLVDWGLALELRNAERGTRNEDPNRTEVSPVPHSEFLTPHFARTRTAIGGRAGSPGYWSPEQAGGHVERQTERTDVYGLGAILYHLLTGTPPHPDGVHTPEAPGPKAAAAWVDDALDGITRKALALDPADRYASATELAAEVERWLADQPVAAQRTAVTAMTRRAEAHPDDAVIQEQLARQRANLGLMLSGMGRDTDALAELAAAADVFTRLFAANPALPRFRAEEANCYLSAAQALENLGRTDEAAGRRKAASDIYAGLIATHPGEFKANIATIIRTHAGDAEGEQHPDQTLAPAELPLSAPGGSVFGTARTPAGEPDLIQGYAVLRPLGQGGLGRVLLARDNVLNRLVAIKDFFPSLPEAARVRVVRELQVTARLIHPNIIRVYTYGIHSDGTRPFMVMEYIPGRSLQGEARAFHAAPGRQAADDPAFARMVSAVAQAADGIHFAHTQGVLHRDPKPSNIMVEEDSGRAVVIDWGLARVTGMIDLPASAEHPGQVLGFPADVGVTHEGAVLGTPAYMSPEQAGGRATGPPSDIYSLGAGLFEVLTGTNPYVAGNVNELLRQVLFGKPHRPRDLNPAVPFELEAICAAAMAYRPEDRYPAASAMATDLRAWLAGKPLSIRFRGRLRRLWEQLTGRG